MPPVNSILNNSNILYIIYSWDAYCKKNPKSEIQRIGTTVQEYQIVRPEDVSVNKLSMKNSGQNFFPIFPNLQTT